MHKLPMLIGALLIWLVIVALREAGGSDDPFGLFERESYYNTPHADFDIMCVLLWGGILIFLVSLVLWPNALGEFLRTMLNHP